MWVVCWVKRCSYYPILPSSISSRDWLSLSVYQVVEYIPRRAYENFSISVSNARHAGDANPDLALLANMSKLVGNSAYGKTITNKEKHKTVKYVEGSSAASAKVHGRNFNSLVEVDKDFYELTLDKSRVSTL